MSPSTNALAISAIKSIESNMNLAKENNITRDSLQRAIRDVYGMHEAVKPMFPPYDSFLPLFLSFRLSQRQKDTNQCLEALDAVKHVLTMYMFHNDLWGQPDRVVDAALATYVQMALESEKFDTLVMQRMVQHVTEFATSMVRFLPQMHESLEVNVKSFKTLATTAQYRMHNQLRNFGRMYMLSHTLVIFHLLRQSSKTAALIGEEQLGLTPNVLTAIDFLTQVVPTLYPHMLFSTHAFADLTGNLMTAYCVLYKEQIGQVMHQFGKSILSGLPLKTDGKSLMLQVTKSLPVFLPSKGMDDGVLVMYTDWTGAPGMELVPKHAMFQKDSESSDPLETTKKGLLLMETILRGERPKNVCVAETFYLWTMFSGLGKDECAFKSLQYFVEEWETVHPLKTFSGRDVREGQLLYTYAHHLAQGKGCEQDMQRAMRFYEVATLYPDADGIHWTKRGEMFLFGNSICKYNAASAMMCFRIATNRYSADVVPYQKLVSLCHSADSKRLKTNGEFAEFVKTSGVPLKVPSTLQRDHPCANLPEFVNSVGRTRFFRALVGDEAASAMAISCDFCWAPASKENKMKRCGGCKSAFYCSLECQKKAWSGGHKRECRALREKNEE